MPGRAPALALLACAALVAAGCGADNPKSGALPEATVKHDLAGSPPALASLHAQSGRLLGGGDRAFNARLASRRGHPVVVNKWASWCGPCREEFPYFQRLSVENGRRIGFLGVDSNDVDDAAKRFLKQYPVSYPSYSDPSLSVSKVFNATVAWPSTAFFDAKGRMSYLHQGVYQSEADLRRDIKRYAQ
jgi:cytochrome c biogenesis protein CcmG/thiol:disulfide interchange protein DsbE